MQTIYARRYDTGEPVCVSVAGTRISSVVPVWPGEDLAHWPYVSPGLFDLQINGHGGVWYCDPALTADQVCTTLQAYWAHGVTRMCPTLITASFAALQAGFTALHQARESAAWVRHMVPGYHLEGPYISGEDGPRGAHPREHVRACDWDEFQRLQEAAAGQIILVTLAAESPGAVEFIRRAVASGVVIALGHTAATSEQVTAAAEAGATLSTHLGNGAHGVLRRHPNYLWDQLGDSRLYASLIVDGHHVPPAFVRSVIRTKSAYRTILTCDASGLAGCTPGEYQLGSGRFEVLPDGRIVIAGQQQLLAGSSLATDTCIGRVMEFAGVSLRDAIDMASRSPARLFGLWQGQLQRGAPADLCLFDLAADEHVAGRKRMRIAATLSQGTVRYGKVPILSLVGNAHE